LPFAIIRDDRIYFDLFGFGLLNFAMNADLMDFEASIEQIKGQIPSDELSRIALGVSVLP
jgi:hypothetical protein